VAVRPVLTVPDSLDILRWRCRAVRKLDGQVRDAVRDLLETFETQAAYGIAAPQVGLDLRIVVVKLEEEEAPFALINPRILAADGELADFDGCLSVPGIYATTRRAARIEVTGQDAEGTRLTLTLEGFSARIMQHEIDHLDGVLFLDRLDSPDDLYRIREVPEKEAEYEAVPLLPEETAALLAMRRPLPPGALRWRSGVGRP
jgi:peptide deformylase